MSFLPRTHRGRRLSPARCCFLVGLALSTVACGPQWTDAQREQVAARYAGTGAARADAPAVVAPADGATVGPEQISVGQELGTGPRASRAPVGGPAGRPRAGGAAPAAGASGKKCAAASAAPGITDDTLTLASISTLSGPVPGIGASSAAGARAHVAYRNSSGGVCGRRIVLKEADDGADGASYRSLVRELEPTVFGIVGGFGLGDVGGRDILTSTKIPAVTAPSAQSVADVPTLFDINPNYASPNTKIGKYTYLFGQGAKAVSFVYLDSAQSRFEANLQQSLMKAAGMKIVDVQALPVSTLSYDPAARRVANSKADYMLYIGDVNGNGNGKMARALKDSGYALKFQEYFVFAYGSAFVEIAGSSPRTWWARRPPGDPVVAG